MCSTNLKSFSIANDNSTKQLQAIMLQVLSIVSLIHNTLLYINNSNSNSNSAVVASALTLSPHSQCITDTWSHARDALLGYLHHSWMESIYEVVSIAVTGVVLPSQGLGLLGLTTFVDHVERKESVQAKTTSSPSNDEREIIFVWYLDSEDLNTKTSSFNAKHAIENILKVVCDRYIITVKYCCDVGKHVILLFQF